MMMCNGERHGHSGKAAATRHLHRPTDFTGPIPAAEGET
jgi:hypothetical protein